MKHCSSETRIRRLVLNRYRLLYVNNSNHLGWLNWTNWFVSNHYISCRCGRCKATKEWLQILRNINEDENELAVKFLSVIFYYRETYKEKIYRPLHRYTNYIMCKLSRISILVEWSSGGDQFAKAGRSPLLPFLSPFLPPFLSFPSPPGVPPLNPARRSGERCELKIMPLVTQNQQFVTTGILNWHCTQISKSSMGITHSLVKFWSRHPIS